MKQLILLVGVTGICLLLSPLVFAQEIRVRSEMVLKEADNQLIWRDGETVSKKKVVLKFEAHRDQDGKFAGYKYADGAIEALKSGDKIMLYMRGISLIEYKGTLQGFVAGKSGNGAWKAVTIESVNRAGDNVEVNIKEEIKLDGGQSKKKLDFSVIDGYLVEKAY